MRIPRELVLKFASDESHVKDFREGALGPLLDEVSWHIIT
jgi:hypothetical protein